MAKIKRTENAARNIIFGGLLKLYQIAVPFLMRTAILYLIGVEYLGLSSLFTSILQVLNLAELGVGSAMVFSMYKPIFEDDDITICALLKLYKIYYHIIGLVIALAGAALTPFVPRLIRGNVPAGMNVYILYLLNLGATVLSYWLLAYKNSILQAHQRTDVISKVTLLTSTVQYGVQILVLWIFRNYYLFVIVALLTQVLTNIITAMAATKLYPNYKARGTVPKEIAQGINRRIRDLFTAKVGGIIVNSADTLVVSAFLGLTMLAIYQNYYFILSSVIGFVTIIFTACTAGIGNSLITDTKEKNFNDLKKFTFIISWIAGFCACCFLNLYQPLMHIWAGEELTLAYSAVVCFALYYYIYEINQLLNLYKDAGGIWHQDRFRPLVTAFANLTMNLIMVQFWGIYGVLLSTVLSMLFVGMPWLFYNLFTTLFRRDQLKPYLLRTLLYAGVSLVVCALSVWVCGFVRLGDWPTLLIRLVICMVLPNVLFLAAYRRLPEFAESVALADNMTKGKLKLKKLFKVG